MSNGLVTNNSVMGLDKMNELRFDHGQGSWPYLIPVEIRPTRTLSKPDGICSSGVGQHPVNARHANLPYNAQTTDVHRRLSTSPVVGDLPLTIHRDSFRPTDKSECMVRRSSANGA